LVRLNGQAQEIPMTHDQEQAAALEEIARVRPAVEKLRSLLAAALAADSASMRATRRRSGTPPEVEPAPAEAEPAPVGRPPGR
jgi:hypothetical protein